jgi:hypothetical protein
MICQKIKLGKLVIGLLLLMVAGCNMREDAPMEPEQAAQFGQQVKVYQAADIAKLNYTSLGSVEASACKFEIWDDTPTEQAVTNQLLAKASAMGANGVANIACESGTGSALARDCWSRVACTGEAIKTIGN